jgi:DNA topoisomerase-1
MEKQGLGTKSTRHDIIQKLYSRGYLEGKYPIPTDSGIAVTKALEHYAEPITKSEMTSTLEEDMTKIAEGEKTREDVVDESKGMLKDIFKTLEPNKRKIGDEIRKALQSQNVISNCKVCEKEGREDGRLVVKRSKRGKRFVGCINYPKCMNSYPLPQKGKVVPVEDRCPTCDAPQVKIISHRRRPWLTCINMECPSKAKKGKKQGEEE